jgi:hypothetical protein
MSQSDGDACDPRPRRSRIARSTKGQDAKGKVKIAAYVSVDSARRLGIHATMTGQDKSTVIDHLIRDHLRRYVVQDRGGPDAGDGGEAAA